MSSSAAKKGNTEELDFLDALAVQESQSDATEAPSASTSKFAQNESLTSLVKGNADELAFLDELAGFEPNKDSDLKTVAVLESQFGPEEAPSASTSKVAQNQSLANLVKGNVDELAFLDEIAGVEPNKESDLQTGLKIQPKAEDAPGLADDVAKSTLSSSDVPKSETVQEIKVEAGAEETGKCSPSDL